MKLGIMQPYFLPYLGYFQLIDNVDHFILLDEVQFIRHGWIERNRILKPGFEDWQYIKVPLKKHSRSILIKDVEIDNSIPWREKIFAQINHYKKGNSRFFDIKKLLLKALEIETESIVALNAHVLKTFCAEIGISTPISTFSEMGLSIEPVAHAGDWALNISKAMGASTYINPADGEELFKQEDFNKAQIELSFHKPVIHAYKQRNEKFIPGLSILDVLLFSDFSFSERRMQPRLESI